MKSTFEEGLLAELKTEIAARASQGRAPAPRRMVGRRFAAGAGVAAIAVATAIVVPLATGSEPPAYALTKNTDGSINLKINEFRNSQQVETDLAELGVLADITYLPLGKRCGNVRAPFVKGDDAGVSVEDLSSTDPVVQARTRKRMTNLASSKAIRPEDGITIYPRYIKPGQTVMIEIMENPVEPTVDRPGVAWQFGGRLTDGPIKPCQVVDDTSAFGIGDATPPPGH
ncbi:hypothetical protein ACIBCT_40080 [Streptosporangium sp. NPDC050855]|uniref:hypothetical protein n=1 Tax=Streptosporangium sp. NPDC050855 TaxID=3366194 RepID=UPI0037A91F06